MFTRICRYACLALVAALAFAPALANNNQIIEQVLPLPGDDLTEVTLVIVPTTDCMLWSVYMDPSPTCTPNGSVPPTCANGLDPSHEVTAIRIGGSFWRTGNGPYTFGSKIATRSLFDENALTYAKPPIPLKAATPFSLTLQTDNNATNGVMVKVTVGLTCPQAPWVFQMTGPVNP